METITITPLLVSAPSMAQVDMEAGKRKRKRSRSRGRR